MIKNYIPLYELLTEHEKTLFLNSFDGANFLAYLERYHGHQSSHTYSCRTRQIAYQSQRAEDVRKYITEKAETSPAFKFLKARIIAKFFPGIEFKNDELAYLSSLPYSTSVLTYSVEQFRNIWVEKFCVEDNNNLEATGIQKNISDQYNGYFGFLFKEEQRLKKLLAIVHAFQSKPKAGRFDFVRKKVQAEWPNPASYTERLLAGVEESLGFLLKNPARMTEKYANDICNAHMVYRFFGLSSENMVLGLGYEGVPIPYINLLDYRSYHQNRKAIGEVLAILQTLGIPFKVFFNEYAHIARFEDNPLVICLRAFIPFFVMGVILSCAYTILLPLAAHAFLEYLLFIPTLYFSIAAAGVYIQYKNSTYTAMLEWWYGSLYMAPQFHANQRIKSAFLNDEVLSTKVAKYYANSLEECDRIEQWYAMRQSKSGLDDDQISKRESNLKLKFDLYMEWYDLHDRQDLGINRIPQIVLGRLRSEDKRLGKKIKEHSEAWCESLHKKQSFFKDPIFSEKFNRLKKCFFAIKSLESDINAHLVHVESSVEHQDLKLDALC
ncbi:MAG: hypothetical protein P1U36_06750 [Legionellaceae bacterium]|nr:hypothetical protein [Legionellaceae bacterium]